MAQKITHWLLITLVLSLGFGQLLRFETPGGAFFIHDILTLVILILNLPVIAKRTTWQFPGISLIGLGLCIGWIVAMVRYPMSQLVIPALYLARLVSYLTLFLSLKQMPKRIPRQVFLASGLITLIIGLMQYFFLPDMRVFQYLGWDDHLNRLTLPHFDPTYTGAMLTLFLFMLNKKEQVYIAIGAFAMCLTYARSIYLSFAAAQIIVLKNVFFLLLVTLFGIYVTFIARRGFGEGTNLLRTYSVESRFGRDYAVIKETGAYLITGLGYNTLAINNQNSEKGYPNHAVGPNSSYIYILTTSGIIGLWGWLIFLKYLYARTPHKAAVLFILIASLFNNVLLYPFTLLWFLLEEIMAPNEA